MKTPVGELKLVANDRGLIAVLWENDDPARVKLPAAEKNLGHPILKQTEQQLREYFKGERKTFTIPLEMYGTDFQKKVWQALLTIPFGETRSYGELAKQIRKPSASRAVGAANGRNPVSILVPCHRVIGAGGKLTGFAGGLEAKAKLLSIES
jgi:methylated-DNA-[protein]-cysteine S-methyltransferase